MIRNFGASGIESQPDGIDIGAGGSNISSIQTVEGAMTPSVTIKDFTISAVDLSRSVIILEYGKVGSVIPASTNEEVAPYFLNKTTVRVTWKTGTAPAKAIYFKLSIIEFNNVKSKQSGVQIGASTQPTTISIASVNVNKCIAITRAVSNSGMSANALDVFQLLTANSLILQTNYSNGSSIEYYWQVIEFK